ncbi:hypothetical protein Purlil1_12875 [Purpureocillium lilacinum]|uniref:RGS domain-containing protein n=1 Tax=Purpureocillium lilacinum TaxID=33203 RepID=A0ABR0BFM9_PURLI|nr:hypothetical protein Purlil1_12875 [Purpureocillium lilacinum]
MDTVFPTLDDVLSNSSPPPWTLHAFAAHLTQHHCLEALHFLLDAENYAISYEKQMNMSIKSPKITDSVPMLWRKLMQAYIRFSGLQQLNIPEQEREHLLNLTSEPPPRPCELHEACKCAYDLLNDSLAAFLRAPQAPTGSLQVPSEHSDQRSQLQPSESGNTSTHLRHSLCVPESEVLAQVQDGFGTCSLQLPSSAQMQAPGWGSNVGLGCPPHSALSFSLATSSLATLYATGARGKLRSMWLHRKWSSSRRRAGKLRWFGSVRGIVDPTGLFVVRAASQPVPLCGAGPTLMGTHSFGLAWSEFGAVIECVVRRCSVADPGSTVLIGL